MQETAEMHRLLWALILIPRNTAIIRHALTWLHSPLGVGKSGQETQVQGKIG